MKKNDKEADWWIKQTLFEAMKDHYEIKTQRSRSDFFSKVKTVA